MILSAVTMALSEIRRNLLRSSLTMLGMVIGVAAVIGMVTLGRGTTAAVTAQISSLGDNLLIVRPGAERKGPPDAAGGGAAPLGMSDVRAIERDVGTLGVLSPESSLGVVVVYGSENHPTSATGATPAFIATHSWTIAQGSMFTDADVQAGRPVCVIGDTVRKELFGAERPIGHTIRLGSTPCEVKGVLGPKGSGMGADQDDTIVLPITAVQRRLQGNDNVAATYISVNRAQDVDKVRARVTETLRARRHIGEGSADDFQVGDMREIAKTVTNATRLLTVFLGAIGGVSLMVGGIGIMNIMLVSVTERTREIGIRLAVGARSRDVMVQFLVEAVVVCLFGGVIGIVVGLFGSWLAAWAFGIPFAVDVWIIAIAFLFCAGIGVVFGFLPARRAARLDPIEALRHA